MNTQEINSFFNKPEVTIDFNKAVKPYDDILKSSEYEEMPDNVKTSTRWLNIWIHEHQVNKCPQIEICATKVDDVYYVFRYTTGTTFIYGDRFVHTAIETTQVESEDDLINLTVKWLSNADEEQLKSIIHFK